MNYVAFSKLYENILFSFDETLLDEYEEGIRKHLLNYIRQVSADKIKDKDGVVFVSDELLTDEYIKDYLSKDDQRDFSAKDCAIFAFVRYNAPPQEYMSVGSLEKKIREIFKEQKEHVYIKRSSGKGNAVCVDRDTAEKIIMHPDVYRLIQKQTVKAENHHEDSVEWRAYEFAKKKVEFLDSYSMEEDANAYYGLILTENQKTNLMVEAVYSMLFSKFDFEKYEKYYDEMEMLYDAWDFGERYQELYDIFHSPDYKNEFYTVNPQNGFLDVLADKITDRIVKKLQEKES